jgi:hypothetical protein
VPPGRHRCPDLDTMKTFDPCHVRTRVRPELLFSGRNALPCAVRQLGEAVVVGLRSDTETMPPMLNARNTWKSVVAVDCASDGAGTHPSTYIVPRAMGPAVAAPAAVAHYGYSDYPGFPPSTPVIFPLFASDFTDLAHLLNTLTVHVAVVRRRRLHGTKTWREAPVEHREGQ